MTNFDNKNFDNILQNASMDVSLCTKQSDLFNCKAKYLGKVGIVTNLAKKIPLVVDINERKEFGIKVNQIKISIELLIHKKEEDLKKLSIEKSLSDERIDITLPFRNEYYGMIHPISQVIEEISTIFASMGFSVLEGPDIEDEFNNFTALNMPDNHPARQMQDSFYLKEKLLRTHTSTIQIHAMKEKSPPYCFIAPGRAYRRDSDQTHTPMFHQIEALYIDTDINFCHLKGCLVNFLNIFFGKENLNMRFRNSYFPFVEPGAEVDVAYSIKEGVTVIGDGDNWLEILGCGMVHPEVLRNAGVDNHKYRGFAIGMGVERLLMLKYGISDIRLLFESDLRFLNHYSFRSFDIPSILGGITR